MAATHTNTEIIEKVSFGRPQPAIALSILRQRVSAAITKVARRDGRAREEMKAELKKVRVANGVRRRERHAAGAKSKATNEAKKAKQQADVGAETSSAIQNGGVADNEVAGKQQQADVGAEAGNAVESGGIEDNETADNAETEANVESTPVDSELDTEQTSNDAAMDDAAVSSAGEEDEPAGDDFEEQLRELEVHGLFEDNSALMDDDVLQLAAKFTVIEIVGCLNEGRVIPKATTRSVNLRIDSAVANMALCRGMRAQEVWALLEEKKAANGVSKRVKEQLREQAKRKLRPTFPLWSQK